MLLPLFEWVEQSAPGVAIRSSFWLFPAVESVHLLGLALMGGAVLIVDLRLCGLGLRSQPVGQLARAAQPWLLGSLIVMLTTGFLLLASEALRCYYNAAFWFKMSSLLLAVLFTFTVRRKIAAADESRVRPVWRKLVGVTSILLWSGVGAGGKGIGFF